MGTDRTDTQDRRRALERFEAIADLAPPERDAALAALSSEDPPLHDRVSRLLAADQGATDAGFLAPPDSDTDRDLAGRMVGPWEVVREIGAGGMGRVWLAKRNDGRYEGQVAIKLLRTSFAGRGLRARFEREGRILGGLAHPGISRLVDAGTLPDGQPYLVLEYVDGERIDKWCDAKRLPVADRVKLFRAVCDAVAYAHANLVVHRDLKPSNILVTAAGEVKLLDFGIAKLLDEERGDAPETELTQMAGRALTPEYAAPEQVSGAPITTATDVYSLGVVLYRLLGGASPYARSDGTHPSAFELQKLVLETEPPRLAATVPSHDTGRIAEVAAARATTPRRLHADLEGDLENIVAKAMKKAPGERYPSAQALRDDLVRFLEHRPVEARGDSAGYVLARFVRRHRLAVGAAAVSALALVAGSAGIAWQARIAKEESWRAQVEADKAKAVSDFMTDIFKTNSTQKGDSAKARATTARELLDIGAARAGKDLAGNPEAHAEVLGLIGQLYYQLDVLAEAVKLERERIGILRGLDPGGSLRLARALVQLAGTLVSQGGLDEAEKTFREALAMLDAIGERRDLSRGDALAGLANHARYKDPGNAASRMREAVTFYAEHHPFTYQRANAQRTLAVILLEQGETREAEQSILKGIEVGEKVLDPKARDLAFMHQIAGNARFNLHDPQKAAQSYRRAIEIDEAAVGGASSFRPVLEANLARPEQMGPDWRASRERLQRVVAGLDVSTPAGKRSAAFVRSTLAHVLQREGDMAGSRAAMESAIADMRTMLPKQMLGGALGFTVEAEARSGRLEAAARALGELETLRQGPLAKNPVSIDRAEEAAARLSLSRGEAEAARERMAKRLAEREAGPAPQHPLDRATLQLLLAEAEEATGRAADAERRSREVLRVVEASAEREWLADFESAAALRVGSATLAQGRRDEALPLLERAVNLREGRQHPASPYLKEARDRLAAARTAR